ncbi:hypothetical protein WMY93_017287 [Mugilogobius chulae]|uniref:Uncharacterized protein n=1 Tax=Mugilogobius chulae TaxID=88201 RepID=A0AAW0NMT9_9GOBI
MRRSVVFSSRGQSRGSSTAEESVYSRGVSLQQRISLRSRGVSLQQQRSQSTAEESVYSRGVSLQQRSQSTAEESVYSRGVSLQQQRSQSTAAEESVYSSRRVSLQQQRRGAGIPLHAAALRSASESCRRPLAHCLRSSPLRKGCGAPCRSHKQEKNVCFASDYGHGTSKTKKPELRLDSERHYQYFRMSAEQMDELLNMIGPNLRRQSTSYRAAIEPKQRLCVALR